MPAIPELDGRLGDGLIELRAIAEWDIPEILIAHQDDRKMHQRLGTRRPPSGSQLGLEVEFADDQRRQGRRFALTIVEPGVEYCRGRVTVHEIDWEQRSARLGIWVAPQYRGRGFARHALLLAARWLFDTVGLQRLTVSTDPDNEPLLHAAAAAGFVQQEPGPPVLLALTPDQLPH